MILMIISYYYTTQFKSQNTYSSRPKMITISLFWILISCLRLILFFLLGNFFFFKSLKLLQILTEQRSENLRPKPEIGKKPTKDTLRLSMYTCCRL